MNNQMRWKQRFQNFQKAFKQLEEFNAQPHLNKLEKQGLIKAFEYNFELAWKTLQDIFEEKGYQGILGPRPVIEQAFKDAYIQDGKAWLKMQKSRNLGSHVYSEDIAEEIIKSIKEEYFYLLQDLIKKLTNE